GFLVRTPRGRMATVTAYEHFERPLHSGHAQQPSLFE
ncbi:MAG: Holliday junction branch migration DNA helicase RuvB, partial [Desulfobulbaceae bacterium]|nr:Holliday junction branch migration DNA helicase RuvB [Desulfobulbaceae bacterium]